MPARGRPLAPLVLTDEEAAELSRLARRGKTSQRLALRSRIVLSAAEGLSNQEVAEMHGCSQASVGKWRSRFLKKRLEGLDDAPRSGAPRKISDAKIEKILVDTLETMPKGASRWRTREMAKHAGISPDSVSKIWRAFQVKPHRSESFQLSTDPDFISKVRDVVGLYMSPPENALVVCVDEKSSIQALDRTQPLLPMGPGDIERHTPECVRNGTTTLFAGLDVATGNVVGKCFRRHRTKEFVQFLNHLKSKLPDRVDVHVVMDNYGTHKAADARGWFARNARFHPHFIPTHSSWLNQVETLFSILKEKQLKRGVHRSILSLEKAISEFLAAHNEDAKPFRWAATADEILARVADRCERTMARHPGK